MATLDDMIHHDKVHINWVERLGKNRYKVAISIEGETYNVIITGENKLPKPTKTRKSTPR